MGQFTIRFHDFALLVHRPGGLTVLFPSHQHTLLLDTGDVEGPRPVAPGASMVLADSQAVPLPGEKTYVSNPDQFVFPLESVVDYPIKVPTSTLNSTVPDPPVSARLVLAGGTLTELKCSKPPLGGPPEGCVWHFANGLTRAVTDLAEFTHPIGDQDTMFLLVNNAAIQINAGNTFTFRNADNVGGGSGEFIQLEEFEALCQLVNAPAAAAPVNLRARERQETKRLGGLVLFNSIKLHGGDFVCAIASIRSDV